MIPSRICSKQKYELFKNLQIDYVLLQVLKGRLSVHQPTIMCDGFVYEEGEDLNEEELEANAANLPKTLHSLPGVHCQVCIAVRANPFHFCRAENQHCLFPFFSHIHLLGCAGRPCANTGHDAADVMAARTSST